MKIPTNSSAVEIVRLRSVNADIDEQIRVLRQQQTLNSETIGVLNHGATWQEEGVTE